MKANRFSILAVVCAAAVTFTAAAQASVIYHNDFTNPLYVVGESVVNVDSWTKTNIASGIDKDVRIVNALGGGVGKGLYLNTGATNWWVGAESAMGIRQTLDAPTTDRVVRFEAKMAFNSRLNQDTGVSSRLYFNNPDPSSGADVSPMQFGFSINSASHGINFVAADGVHVVLVKSKVVAESLYTFTVDFDFDAKTFNISISGLQVADGGGTEAFSWTSDTSYAFIAGNTGLYSDSIKSFTIAQNTGVLNTYLDEVTIRAIPEPSSVAALLGGSAMLLALRFRKR